LGNNTRTFVHIRFDSHDSSGRTNLFSLPPSLIGSHEPRKERIEQRSSLLRATADYLPKIKRGFFGSEEKEDEGVVSSGWKTEVRTRKEREETLRDGVHQFERQMKKFHHLLEEGVETVMWQLNRSAEQSPSDDEFAIKASHVTVSMQRKGDLLLQSVLNFNLRGGYLSKAIGRNRAGKYSC